MNNRQLAKKAGIFMKIIHSILLSVFLYSITSISVLGCEYEDRDFPLHDSILDEKFEVFSCLLASGYDPNQPDQTGNHPIESAVDMDPIFTAKLLEFGADPNTNQFKTIRKTLTEIRDVVKRISREQAIGDSASQTFIPEERVRLSHLIANLDTLVVGGAEFGAYIGMCRGDTTGKKCENSVIFEFIYTNCNVKTSRYMDYSNIIEIASKRNIEISRPSETDIANLRHIYSLSDLGLYDKNCIDAYQGLIQKSAR